MYTMYFFGQIKHRCKVLQWWNSISLWIQNIRATIRVNCHKYVQNGVDFKVHILTEKPKGKSEILHTKFACLRILRKVAISFTYFGIDGNKKSEREGLSKWKLYWCLVPTSLSLKCTTLTFTFISGHHPA